MVEHEINVAQGGLVFLGNAPSYHDVLKGRPFVEYDQGGAVLEECMNEAGIVRKRANFLNISRLRPPGDRFEAHPRASLEAEMERTRRILRNLRPKLIVALGNEASWLCVPDWPDARRNGALARTDNILGATGIEERRGYVFDSIFDCPVLVTVHPASVARVWTPWRVLLSYDLQKAQEIYNGHLCRPSRSVHVVTSDRDARLCVEGLRNYGVLAADIEGNNHELTCIGFAGESGQGVVFPARYLSRARELLESPLVTTVWANGIYDLFVLKHGFGVDIKGRVEDAQIAWHACYPEIAGKSEDSKGHKMTRKSLAFLASMATLDPWWKDYEFANDMEEYTLNGRDACITLDVWNWVQDHLDSINAHSIYEHERGLMWPCVDMLARGLRVNEDLRLQRLEALNGLYQELESEIVKHALPIIERNQERLETLGLKHLFEETEGTCECCRHASKKQTQCWSCAGFDKAPSKKDLVLRGGDASKSKVELEEEFLGVCLACQGKPRQSWLTYNPNSDAQKKALFYDLLKLPVRMLNGKPTTNEDALKSLVQYVS